MLPLIRFAMGLGWGSHHFSKCISSSVMCQFSCNCSSIISTEQQTHAWEQHNSSGQPSEASAHREAEHRSVGCHTHGHTIAKETQERLNLNPGSLVPESNLSPLLGCRYENFHFCLEIETFDHLHRSGFHLRFAGAPVQCMFWG